MLLSTGHVAYYQNRRTSRTLQRLVPELGKSWTAHLYDFPSLRTTPTDIRHKAHLNISTLLASNFLFSFSVSLIASCLKRKTQTKDTKLSNRKTLIIIYILALTLVLK